MTKITTTSRPLRSRAAARRGAAMVAALVCLLVVSALVGSMLLGTLRLRRHLRLERDVRQTELLVEAGADRAAVRLAREADYRGEAWRIPSESIAGRQDAEVTITAVRDTDDAPWRVDVRAEYPSRSATSMRRSRSFLVNSTIDPIEE